jgi:hypothetical protein
VILLFYTITRMRVVHHYAKLFFFFSTEMGVMQTFFFAQAGLKP